MILENFLFVGVQVVVFSTLPNNQAICYFNHCFTLERFPLHTAPSAASVSHIVILAITEVIFVLNVKSSSNSRNQSVFLNFEDVGIFTPIFQEQICNARIITTFTDVI